jgi:cytochrome c peroxidase
MIDVFKRGELMRKLLSVRLGIVCGLALVGAICVAAMQSAEARPQYNKAFTDKYPKVTEAKTVKCNVCHVGQKKADRNAYGKALATAIGKKNEKDQKAIDSAFAKVAKEKVSEDGKTFGELLESGELPAKSE